MAREGSRAKLGVVFLAPLALAFGALGLFIGATPRGLVESSGVTGPTRGGWTDAGFVACLVVAAVLLVGWVGCIVRVWTTREREDEPIPNARAIGKPDR